MSWKAPPIVRRIRSLPSHLHELAARLAHVSQETQARIAETVAATIAQIARDGLQRYWSGSPARPLLATPTPQYDDWGEPLAEERWDDPHEFQCDPEFTEWVQPQPAAQSHLLPPAHVTALSLKVAAWYLLRRGSLVGALGLGALVGGAALIGGRIVLTGFDLLQTASELATLNQGLANGTVPMDEV